MASGFSGSDFYSHSRIGRGGSAVTNSVRVQYHPQFGGILIDPSPSPSPSPAIPQQSAIAKRSLNDFHMQQQQSLLLLRSVKQRTLPKSPISPVSPFDFSSATSEIPSNSFESLGASPFWLQKQQPHTPNLLNRSFPAIPNRFSVSQSEPKKETMRNRLQELERELLDDKEDEEGICGAVCALTSSEWRDTMQNLIAPKPVPTSPTISSSSCTAASSSPSLSPAPTLSSCQQLLMDSATAISDGKMETASGILAGLKQVSNPLAGGAEQRLAAYMVTALLSRINPEESNVGPPTSDLCSVEHLAATQKLYEASPIFKFGFMAANLAILEATRDRPKIHIVDFDIGDGTRYTSLIKALAEQRQLIKPTVKITAFSDPSSVNVRNSNGFQFVRDRLTRVAEMAGITLRFTALDSRAVDLRRESIGCDPDEAVAVSFPFRLSKVADESVSPANPRDGLLRAAKGLRPEVVVLLEQEMNSNTAPFRARFGSVWAHYLALFESLDSIVARDGLDQVRVEECLGRKAGNAVAREGMDRVERCEVFGKWRARMGMAGFKARPLGAHAADLLQTQLGTSQTQLGFSVKEEGGGICIGWMGQILTVTSAWC